MSKQLEKFISLLEEMFQFDQADLDFGIYRIMNQKREEIQSFLKNDLMPQVNQAFEKFKNYEVDVIKQELEQLEKQLSDMGVAKESSEKYQSLSAKLSQSVDTSALENDVYSHLTNFFKRYYSEGDFISLRRYKKDVYAIPYEGEEVKLHWANADQYYIKSSEQFKDYSFTLPSGKKVHFKLVEASTEQNNNKAQSGKERRFILSENSPIIENGNELYIHFEYTVDDKKRSREKINLDTLDDIYNCDRVNDWIKELKLLAPTAKNKNRTLLEKHLNDYTAKNTFDYFIHKELGVFLNRELDYYIKNEVMHLDDLDLQNEENFVRYLSKIKVIKSLGYKIITFLAQVEDFQKKLWLKKKFIVETNYCITLDRVPQELFKDIINNHEQLEEWKKLFSIELINDDLTTVGYSEPLKIEFLEQNRFLLLDTKFFDEEFKIKLLKSIENLDESIDGILINSDNFHALNLLQERYKQNINCVYADPPYNAKSSEILYKNSFKHSSWMSFMLDRIKLASNLKSKNGALITAIDENEITNLMQLFNEHFPYWEKNSISIVHNPAGVQGDNFSYSHEYAIFAFETQKGLIGKADRDEVSEEAFRDWGGTSARSLAKNCFYPIYVKNDAIIGFGDVCPDDFHPGTSNIINGDIIEVYPIAEDGEERKWVFARDTVESIIDNLIVKNRNGTISISRSKSKTSYKTVWTDKRYYANIYGSKLLNNILGSKKFDFPKSVYTVQDCLFAINSFREKDAIAVDYFAGSGTTGNAVINLNREDNGHRKYILIEMGEYFETVTKPRIQKIIYSKDWKDGKPVSREGSSHLFKYMRLESYEDALNNIIFNQTEEQLSALDQRMSTQAREEYFISYMLGMETKNSTTLLNIDKLTNPFDYKMKISNGSESKLQIVDLVETFNYLLGLQVKSIDFIKGCKLVVGNLKTNEKVLIIWRNSTEISNEQLNELLRQLDINSRDAEYDLIYVNGDNHIENLKVDESNWKVRLIEEEFKRLMFEVNDI
ncbi:site-specific DNA-methyltransferase [Solibacillus sp. A46]|uniref:Site-specific DNA-methyltransferase n=1 Tax=Solibacillus faecavium TaxID=2762221 RepID=A0ABR8XXH6_9BACL|nr:DNA methyltransferase [Solibacillus faecavium]MBD8036640.1 site-specific DNA-methyltransferase [Solibacillus faecavium]